MNDGICVIRIRAARVYCHCFEARENIQIRRVIYLDCKSSCRDVRPVAELFSPCSVTFIHNVYSSCRHVIKI